MHEDIKLFVKVCEKCQKMNPTTARKYIVYRVAQKLHTKSYTDTYAETLVSGHIWVWNADHVKIRSSEIGCFHQSIMQLSAAFINRSCNYRLLSSIDHATIGCYHPFMPIKKCSQPIDDPSIETSIPSIEPR